MVIRAFIRSCVALRCVTLRYVLVTHAFAQAYPNQFFNLVVCFHRPLPHPDQLTHPVLHPGQIFEQLPYPPSFHSDQFFEMISRSSI